MRTGTKGSTPGLFKRLFLSGSRQKEACSEKGNNGHLEKERVAEETVVEDRVVDGALPAPYVEPLRRDSDFDSDSDEEANGITYPEGGLEAWIVAFGAWAGMVSGFGVCNTMGVLSAWISVHQLSSYSESTISWIFGIYVFIIFFCGLQIGPIFDAKGPKLLLATGAVLSVTSLMLLGVCTQLWHFIVVFSLVGGLGASLLFTPPIATISHWFSRRRAFAGGMVATGGAIGGTVFPLMLQALLPRIGWAWATRVLGFCVLFMASISVALCRSRLPPKKGDATTWRDMLPDFRIFNDGNGALIVTTAGIFFIEWGLFVPVTYIASYYLAREGTTSDPFAFQLLSIFNGSSFFGRWLPGLAADKIGRFNTMILTTVLCVVAIFGLWLPDAVALGAGDSVGLVVAFAVVFGFASGSGIGLTPICVGQLCETQEFGRYYATSYTIVSFSSLTGIPIAGALLSATGDVDGASYWAAITFTGLCYAVALACFVWVRVRIKGWGWSTRW